MCKNVYFFHLNISCLQSIIIFPTVCFYLNLSSINSILLFLFSLLLYALFLSLSLPFYLLLFILYLIPFLILYMSQSFHLLRFFLFIFLYFFFNSYHVYAFLSVLRPQLFVSSFCFMIRFYIT